MLFAVIFIFILFVVFILIFIDPGIIATGTITGEGENV
ncbi:Uncharacterised protein [Shigella sonnei]|nr:Uncharacterised protein [Shigella sonnei]